MSEEHKPRPLLDNERQVMEIIHAWNHLADNGKQHGVLTLSIQGADAVVRHGIAQPFKMESVEAADRVRLYFTLVEMEKYIYFAAKQVGFTILLNGGVRTADGLFVEPAPVKVDDKVFS